MSESLYPKVPPDLKVINGSWVSREDSFAGEGPDAGALHQVKLLERRVSELTRQLEVEKKAGDLREESYRKALDDRDAARAEVCAGCGGLLYPGALCADCLESSGGVEPTAGSLNSRSLTPEQLPSNPAPGLNSGLDLAVTLPASTVEKVREALREGLGSHMNLYLSHFGAYCDPEEDLVRKQMRAALAALPPPAKETP